MELDDFLVQYLAEVEAADAAPVEQYERCGELVGIVGAKAAITATGCNSTDAYPKVCLALAAAADADAEAAAWRELSIAPKRVVHNVALPLAKQMGMLS